MRSPATGFRRGPDRGPRAAGRRSRAGPLAGALLVAPLLLGGSCEAPAEPVTASARVRAEVRFAERSHESGLGVVGRSSAAAAADFDRDGWPDLAVSTHGSTQLFHNQRGSFQDLSAAVGFLPEDTHGISWLDVDHDGWLDLLVSVGADRGFGRGDKPIYLNRAGREWVRHPAPPEPLRDPLGRGRCLCALDLDRDGGLDVVAVNAFQQGRPSRLARWAGEGRYVEPAAAGGVASLQAECLTSVALGGSAGAILIAYGGGAHSGHAFRAGPEGALIDVTREVGLPQTGPTVYSAVAGDYDSDGDLDVYFVHGVEVPPAVTRLEGGIGFRLVSKERGDVPELRFRHGGSFTADLWVGFNQPPKSVFLGSGASHPSAVPWTIERNDPRLDGAPRLEPDSQLGLYLWRAAPDEYRLAVVGDGQRVRGVAGTFSAPAGGFEILAPAGGLESWQRVPNRLFENVGGRFVEVTERAGVGDDWSGRDAAFFDADNDGDLDLFVVNGGLAFAQHPDVLYLNRGDGTFSPAGERAGASGAGDGRGASVTVLDYDRDGLVDLFVTNGDGPPPGERGPYSLLRNETTGAGRWVEVDLAGGSDNPTATGTVVVAHFGGRRVAQQRTSSTSRFATSVQPLHFGLGPHTAATIEVHWPSGRVTRLLARHGQRLLLREPEPATAAGRPFGPQRADTKESK